MKQDCGKLELLFIRINEDSPKHSTALKLERLGLAKRISTRHYYRRKVVLLDPFADTLLTRDERGISGIIVVDRSWKKMLDDRRVPAPRGRVVRRRLPEAKASNPINYSKLGILSSAEAFALALITLCCFERAYEVLSKFKWGPMFLELNNDIIETTRKRCSASSSEG